MNQIYQKLHDRVAEIITLLSKYESSSKEWFWLANEMDGIVHFFEAGGKDNYEFIASFARNRGIRTVYDIGCASGCQSECFFDSAIQYVGVDDNVSAPDHFRWNQKTVQYVTGSYPDTITLSETGGALAVSVLCLGWEIYRVSEDTWDKQFQKLSEDFSVALVYVSRNAIPTIEKYWLVERLHKEETIGEWLFLRKKGGQ